MHYVVLLLITTVMLASYMAFDLHLPQAIRFLPELLTAGVSVYVVLAGIRTRLHYVRPLYWVLFGSAAFLMICGIIANQVDSGPIIAGLRFYLRAIPFFLLPMVCEFEPKQIRQQLQLVMAFALLQLPLAVYQRYSQLQSSHSTGDYVYGTLMQSGALTIFLLSVVSVVIALAIRQRLTVPRFAMLFVALLIPTAINETKITVFLLPLAIVVTILVASSRGKRGRMLGAAAALMLAAGLIFVPIFNYLAKQNVSTQEASSLSDMFTKKDWFKQYLDQGSSVGSKKEIGRVDALTVPLTYIAGDPVTFAFGLGVGNASTSSLGAQFNGAQAALLGKYSSGTTAGSLMLELGMLGTLCVLLLHWAIFRDSLWVASRANDLTGMLAMGWPAVALIATITLFYVPTLYFESASYLFWYFSGVIAAQRMRITYTAQSAANAGRRPPARTRSL